MSIFHYSIIQVLIIYQAACHGRALHVLMCRGTGAGIGMLPIPNSWQMGIVTNV